MQENLGIQDAKLRRATKMIDDIEQRLSQGWLEKTNVMTKKNEENYLEQ